jgi:hypothetical protein
MSVDVAISSVRVGGLTYAEGVLVAGDFEDGVLLGFTARDRDRYVGDARRVYVEFRAKFGYKGYGQGYLTKPDAQAKLGKSERYALGLMLTPAGSLDVGQFLPGSRPVNVCPRASAGCAAACLSQSGHGKFDATQKARQVRHAFLLAHPFSAGVLIGREIRQALNREGRDRVTFRFNVVSDYRIERIMPRAIELLIFSGVRVYDYTAWTPADRDPMPGYTLIYSAKESSATSDGYLAGVLRAGHNVAMPFHGDVLPSAYRLDGELFAVIDGDKSDDRTDDRVSGVIIGLKAKGDKGKADTSGFIRSV